ncbi:hypothetical protein XENORESO_017815, partial [Xenotaenia resolanae]
MGPLVMIEACTPKSYATYNSGRFLPSQVRARLCVAIFMLNRCVSIVWSCGCKHSKASCSTNRGSCLAALKLQEPVRIKTQNHLSHAGPGQDVGKHASPSEGGYFFCLYSPRQLQQTARKKSSSAACPQPDSDFSPQP